MLNAPLREEVFLKACQSAWVFYRARIC
jgi:hypothetical protein